MRMFLLCDFFYAPVFPHFYIDERRRNVASLHSRVAHFDCNGVPFEPSCALWFWWFHPWLIKGNIPETPKTIPHQKRSRQLPGPSLPFVFPRSSVKWNRLRIIFSVYIRLYISELDRYFFDIIDGMDLIWNW